MATPIPYPVINGNRHSFASTIFKLDGQEFQGYTKLNYSRKRTRSKVWGPNPDPLGKTRGQNDYTCKITVLVAEFKAFVQDHFGPGYGDVYFTAQITFVENGFDTMDVQIQGCTIDEHTLETASGTDATEVELDFNPLKIIGDGIDDNATPLVGAQAQA